MNKSSKKIERSSAALYPDTPIVSLVKITSHDKWGWPLAGQQIMGDKNNDCRSGVSATKSLFNLCARPLR
jgi:hypothetical protein